MQNFGIASQHILQHEYVKLVVANSFPFHRKKDIVVTVDAAEVDGQ
ncbi:hypothetical protein Vi05172_g1160 [Venturia inaequalis]|nr:hypothetical protein Vi05172_g1160 [Venturia inaequalis]